MGMRQEWRNYSCTDEPGCSHEVVLVASENVTVEDSTCSREMVFKLHLVNSLDAAVHAESHHRDQIRLEGNLTIAEGVIPPVLTRVPAALHQWRNLPEINKNQSHTGHKRPNQTFRDS